MQASFKLIRLKSVLEQIGLGKTTVYKLIKAGLFPPPVRIGKRAVAWNAEHLEKWLQERQNTCVNQWEGGKNV